MTSTNGHADTIDRAAVDWLVEHGAEGAARVNIIQRVAIWLYSEDVPLQQAYRLCAEIAAQSRPPFDPGTMYRQVDSVYGLTAQTRASERQQQDFAAAVSTVRAFMLEKSPDPEWGIRGFFAKGVITQVTAKIKDGKTVLVRLMMRAVSSGESTFLGQTVTPMKVFYLTEENENTIRKGLAKLGLTDTENMCVVPRNRVMKLKLDWPTLVARSVEYCKAHGIDVLVVDTLARFSGVKDENDSVEAMRAMEPLTAAAAEGLAIVVVSHDRKSGGEPGDSGRGSSAWGGEMDIILGLRVVTKRSDPQRMLVSGGRYDDDTPSELVIELTDQGYVSRGEPKTVKVEDERQALLDCIPLGRSRAKKWTDVLEEVDLSQRRAKAVLNLLVTGGRVRKGTSQDRSHATVVWRPGVVRIGPSGVEDTAEADAEDEE
jgi:hypothetical protein